MGAAVTVSACALKARSPNQSGAGIASTCPKTVECSLRRILSRTKEEASDANLTRGGVAWDTGRTLLDCGQLIQEKASPVLTFLRQF